MSKEKEVLESGRLGQVIKVGDFVIRRGTIIKEEDGDEIKIFFTDYQVNSDDGGEDLPKGTLVGYRVLTNRNGAMIGRGTEKIKVSPEGKATPLVMGVYSAVAAMVPPIEEDIGKPEMPKREWGFDKSRTTLPELK